MSRRHWSAGAGVLAVSLVALIRRRLLLVAVHGVSMAPIYQDGDTLLAVRLSRSHPWRVGDDLVFDRIDQPTVPGDPPYLVKRVCAVPGDPIPHQAEGFAADLNGSGLMPLGTLLLAGMNSSLPPFFYSVLEEAVIGKVVCRLRKATA